MFYRIIWTACVVMLFFTTATAQATIKGRVADINTKEPVTGATIQCIGPRCKAVCLSNDAGEFQMICVEADSLLVSNIGYHSKTIFVSDLTQPVWLSPAANVLNEVVISASRGETVKRSQAPIAITSISSRTIQDTRPVSADQLLNKVSGVNMVSLGNEQHQMSIRQPITTKSLFLYLEDGIPVRTTGLFNHNALLEMNMAATKTIEVIKGPSSSLYGSEAVGGVVNFITVSPTAVPLAKLSLQGNNIGYKRAEWQAAYSKNKLGFALSGYYAQKRNGFMDYSDFHKATVTARLDYRFSAKTNLSSSVTWTDYYSDMPGGVDSLMFASKKFSNPQTFTYRAVQALRFRSTVTQVWNETAKTTVSLVYRDNSIGQNPAYRIKDDYRKTGNTWTGKKDLAHGEINESAFNSYSLIAQHRQKLNWKDAVLVGGISADLSPSSYDAAYIRIKKDTVTRKYVSYDRTDSVLTHYRTTVNNYAAFLNFECSPFEKLRVVASLRYDLFHYRFDNKLSPSAFSGSADTVNRFYRLSPKFGFTYSLSRKAGLYANYSQGFVPPQVSEMYTGIKVPNIRPSVFYNYEIGGWSEIIRNKLSFDLSAYYLQGTNEIISVKLDDGSSENRNAGRTSHKGIEAGLTATVGNDLTMRFSAAYSKHHFTSFIEKGNDYSGYEMNGAPRWIHNIELWYKPSFVKGLRLGAEWQKVGAYFMDPKNTARYQGYNLFNLRAGYTFNEFEVWLNVLNVTGEYYSNLTTKSGSGRSYQLAEPRNFNIGIAYDLARILKK